MLPLKLVSVLVVLAAIVAGAFFVGERLVMAPQALVAPTASTTPAGSIASSSVSGAATSSTPSAPTVPHSAFKATMTTYFFVGEPSEASNAFIPNDVSYWDSNWETHFGGVDDPSNRCGYNPCGFTPKENPFYFALPYGEFTPDGNAEKPSAKKVPWYQAGLTPLLKNHWIEVKHNGKICYGQWEDVGPNNEDDFAYVFGKAAYPSNTFGAQAGLDVSPALWDCLGMEDNATTSWTFIDARTVPDGPWKAVVTSSGISW